MNRNQLSNKHLRALRGTDVPPVISFRGMGVPTMILFPRRPTSTRLGATSTEYMLIMALVVLPIGLLFWLFRNMIIIYGTRVFSLMGLPFP